MSKGKKEKDAIYVALSHPLRRRILKIIGEKGHATFTDFIQNLNIEVGTLYYHLNLMKPLLRQDEAKRYLFSDLGHLAYQIMITSEEKLRVRRSIAETRVGKFSFIFGFKPIFSYVSSSSPKRFFFEVIVLLFIGSWITANSGLQPLLLFFIESYTTSTLFMGVYWILNWLIIFLLLEVFSRVFYGRREGWDKLLVNSCFALLPLLFFAGLWWLDDLLKLNLMIFFPGFSSLVMFLVQAWCLWSLSLAVSISKEIRVERGFLLCLLIHYVSVMALWVVVGTP